MGYGKGYGKKPKPPKIFPAASGSLVSAMLII